MSKSYLFITEYFPETGKDITGGVEARTYNVARQLVQQQHTVTVLCSYQQGKQRTYELDGISVKRTGFHHPYTNQGAILSRLCLALSLFLAGCKLVRSLKPEVVIGENFISYLPTFFAGIFASQSNVYATYHETWLGEWIKNKGLLTGICGELWERTVLSLAWHKIISVSHFTQERLIKNGIRSDKVVVIPNGINLADFQSISVPKASSPTICNISRLTPHKRVDDLIRAVAQLKADIPDIKCHIIGTGDELDNLKQLAQELAVTDNIIFHGFVKDHQDVVKTLKSSHIFCSPSTLEGFGIVVLEACALGVPFVISDIPPFKEVSRNGQGGRIFEQRQINSLTAKLKELLEDKATYKQLENDALDLAESYDWQLIVKEHFS